MDSKTKSYTHRSLSFGTFSSSFSLLSIGAFSSPDVPIGIKAGARKRLSSILRNSGWLYMSFSPSTGGPRLSIGIVNGEKIAYLIVIHFYRDSSAPNSISNRSGKFSLSVSMISYHFTLIFWPIFKLFSLTPGLSFRIFVTVVPYFFANIQYVSPFFTT